jgi:hypothetical protein
MADNRNKIWFGKYPGFNIPMRLKGNVVADICQKLFLETG